MAHTTPQRKRQGQDGKEVYTASFARYLVIHRSEEGKSFTKVNPFVIQSGLVKVAGPVKSCTRLRSGSLLIESYTATQFDKLLKAKLLHGYPIRVEEHRSLNSSKGVITTSLLDDMPEEQILLVFHPLGVKPPSSPF